MDPLSYSKYTLIGAGLHAGKGTVRKEWWWRKERVGGRGEIAVHRLIGNTLFEAVDIRMT